MNREILKDELVSNGHSYANDALKEICTKIFPFDTMLLMQHSSSYSPYPDHVKVHADNMSKMIVLFNQIVSNGREFALQFIKNNWKLYSDSEFINDGEFDIKSARAISPIKLTKFRSGFWNGTWSGWYVTVQYPDHYSDAIKLDAGIKGIDVKCKVFIDTEGQLYVK